MRSERSTMLLSLFAACGLILAPAEKKEKPRELYEISSENVDVGMEPFYEGNMEPFGVVCVGYVKRDSPNHMLLKELAAATKVSDEALYDLQIPMAAALDWQEEESLQIVKRTYAAKLWEAIELPPLDVAPIEFPGKAGKAWKKKQLRQWLLDNGWATINYRIAGYQGKKQPFPFWKYFGKGNAGGVGLIMVKMKDVHDFGVQFRAVRAFRSHIDKLEKKIRFAVVEKSKSTLEMRQALKLGTDDDIESEFFLIEDAGKQDQVDNHWHGNPKKYRLQNFSEEAIQSFFDAYYAGKLPTFWASVQEGKVALQWSDVQLKGMDFETKVYGADKEVGLLVAFFNDNPDHGCQQCVHARKVWDDVAKEVSRTKALKRIVIASLDQSAHEHPENLVPNKLGQAVVVYYPPGKASQRKKRRQVLHALSESFSFDSIMARVKDIAFDLAEDEEEL